jgi:GxxExxY protein
MIYYETQKDIDALSYEIIGCAIEIHKELGPGLLESAYEKCMLYLLQKKGYFVESQKLVPIIFRDLVVEDAHRLDLLVENRIIVEIKAVKEITDVHKAQLLTYLNFMEMPKGILINFQCSNIFKDGQRTFVTDEYAKLPKHR